MKYLILVMLLITTGCATLLGNNIITRAQYYCQDKGGIDYMLHGGIDAPYVYCNNGQRTWVDGVKMEGNDQ